MKIMYIPVNPIFFSIVKWNEMGSSFHGHVSMMRSLVTVHLGMLAFLFSLLFFYFRFHV